MACASIAARPWRSTSSVASPTRSSTSESADGPCRARGAGGCAVHRPAGRGSPSARGQEPRSLPRTRRSIRHRPDEHRAIDLDERQDIPGSPLTPRRAGRRSWPCRAGAGAGRVRPHVRASPVGAPRRSERIDRHGAIGVRLEEPQQGRPLEHLLDPRSKSQQLDVLLVVKRAGAEAVERLPPRLRVGRAPGRS